MNKDSEGVITIAVSGQRLRIELACDVASSNVVEVVKLDSKRGQVLMSLLGNTLRKGPIVCSTQMEVDELVALITKPKPPQSLSVDVALSERDGLSFGVGFGQFDLGTHVEHKLVPRSVAMPFHQQLNQPPVRKGREEKKPKVSRRSMLGKKK